MRTIRTLLVALVTVLAIGVMTSTATATTIHPFFLTPSGKNVAFSGGSGESVLRAEQLGLPAEITCGKDTTSGELINESTLARKIELELSGKCLEVVDKGVFVEKCTEPIKLKLLYGELGLINSSTKKDALFLQPESGKIFAKITCGANETTFSGAVVGEFPEETIEGTHQYNKELTSFVRLEAKEESKKQELTEILLLGTQMTGIKLTAEGFLGGEASWESSEAIGTKEDAVIVSGPQIPAHPLFLTQSGKTLAFSGTNSASFLRYESGQEDFECEKGTSSGEILNKSTLARKIELTFSGKCLEVVRGTSDKCTEPIVFKLTVGELGLISPAKKTVVLLLSPESGKEFASITCEDFSPSHVDGAIIGEFPELNVEARNQYNNDLEKFELILQSESKTSKPKLPEIFLLETEMKGVALFVEGFFSGSGSEEYIDALTLDGNALIDTK